MTFLQWHISWSLQISNKSGLNCISLCVLAFLWSRSLELVTSARRLMLWTGCCVWTVTPEVGVSLLFGNSNFESANNHMRKWLRLLNLYMNLLPIMYWNTNTLFLSFWWAVVGGLFFSRVMLFAGHDWTLSSQHWCHEDDFVLAKVKVDCGSYVITIYDLP